MTTAPTDSAITETADAVGIRSSALFGLFDPPPATKYNFLSLGAGVQSSTLALMAAHGEIGPMPDAAIFADTQAEPESVYRWLDWLEKQLPFPLHRVTRGSLTEDSLIIRERKDKTGFWSKSLIPAFVANADGTKGIMSRQCTYDYKVEQLERAARRLAQVKRGQKEITVTQWIGISWDEMQRMKNSRTKWAQHRWPLIERKMRRSDCLAWMESNGYPKPPRSACIYCPYHSDSEWRRLRDEEPEEFQKAIEFDHKLREIKAKTERMKGVPYLHPSLKPLDQVDLRTDVEHGQGLLWNDMQNECAGMCGV
jgi:3'-phosphoadenosine 5'-phosphosulfate sulfotransferase (PAPS reductase)/FAD synthetase